MYPYKTTIVVFWGSTDNLDRSLSHCYHMLSKNTWWFTTMGCWETRFGGNYHVCKKHLSVSGCVRAHMHAIVHVDAGCASAKLLTPLNMGGYGSMWTNSTKRWPFKTTPVMRKSGQVSATCNSLKQVAGQHIYTITRCATQHHPRRERSKRKNGSS